MNYEVKFHKDALKYLQKQDIKSRNRILDHINLIADNPNNKELDIVKMQGIENHFRLRVGSYRIVYTINNDVLVIIIVKIGSRGDVYKS